MVILGIIDIILFIIVGISVLYLFVYAFYSLKGWKLKYPQSKRLYNFAILIPAYKEDNIIEKTIRSLLLQDYPRELYNIVVISDQMSEDVNDKLRKLPITLLTPVFNKSSKANALNFAMDYLKNELLHKKIKYEIITILDSDNIVESDYLRDISNAFNQDIKAIQAHRIAKNRDTQTAILDAVSEEINNSIFRKGHVNMGVSSALIGSGMAFDFNWFAQNIKNASTAGEDKELEVMLLKQGIYIDYLNDTLVYDEKVAQSKAFYNQRRRWLAAQFSVLVSSIKELPGAIKNGNVDYCDKLFQWMLLPRAVLLMLLCIMSVVTLIIEWSWAVKWWALLLMLLFALAFSIPDYLVDKQFKKSISHIPLLAIMMFFNLFRLRGVNKKFIHTQKKVI
ncbi:MAG: glycosyltransferase family 2 protein [Bacteroidales bacterium]